MAVNPTEEMSYEMYEDAASDAMKMAPTATNVGGILAAPSAMPFGEAASGSLMSSGSMPMSTSMSMGGGSMPTMTLSEGGGMATPMSSMMAAGDNVAPMVTGVPAAVGAAAVGIAMLL